jgi:hypothetical protein
MRLLQSSAAAALIAALLSPMMAQVMEGEVQVTVRDRGGLPLAASVEISSRSPQFRIQARAGADGKAKLQRLPAGVYLLSVRQEGFRDFSQTVEIRSAVPQQIDIALQLGVLTTEITVTDTAPLFDTTQASRVVQLGRQQLDAALATTLGRSTIDAVTTTPGWLLEANAVLHPRGSEYDTQYVVDGMPVYDNRSIAFAPAFENDEFEGVNMMTAGIPAEYGRRLGGVISLDTRRIGASNTEVIYQGGTFQNHSGSLTHQQRWSRSAFAVGVHGGRTDRYLDPPSLENFTNRGSAGGFNARFEQDLTPADRLTFYLRSNRTNFLVPNDPVQQAAGQRQDRRSSETAGQVHYQHIFSDSAVAATRGMLRDLSSVLWSNPLAMPVYAAQDRGFREAAIIGSVTIESRRQTFKFGGDFRTSNIREAFALAEPDELPELDLDFRGRRRSKEGSGFVQDHLRLGHFSANVGIRYDLYRLLVSDSAFSPRVGLSYYVPKANVLLRASYDRIFQPPPIENLLFSSAAAGLGIDDVEASIPVPAGRANFFEVGFSKPLFNTARLDVSHYWRTFRNYQDDDVFFNTGFGFPITFDTARIQGTEVRLELPRWRWLSSSASWSNMHGIASGPVTGGLFIRGGEAEELRDSVQRFPITQDQRNTVAGQMRYQVHPRLWLTVDARYGSGLPVELHEEDGEEGEAEDEQEVAQAILDQVDFQRGRVRPNFALNFSAGARVWEQGDRSATVQFDVRNVTDRLNVINFTGVFSGTALAPSRQFSVQLKLRF